MLYEKSTYELREGERAVSRAEHKAMIAEFRKEHPKPEIASSDPIWARTFGCHACHREGEYGNGTKCHRCDGNGHTFDNVAIIPSAAERLADLEKELERMAKQRKELLHARARLYLEIEEDERNL